MGLLATPPWLLIASPEMSEDFFSQGVFLIIEHDEEGSIGFLINRRCHENLDEVIKNSHDDIPEDIPTWFGGPAEADRGLILSHERVSEEDDSVAPDCYISTAPETIELLYKPEPTEAPRHPYRFISGYTAWESKQLDKEIREGKWMVIPYDKELVFNTSTGNIWPQAIGAIGLAPAKMFAQTVSHIH